MLCEKGYVVLKVNKNSKKSNKKNVDKLNTSDKINLEKTDKQEKSGKKLKKVLTPEEKKQKAKNKRRIIVLVFILLITIIITYGVSVIKWNSIIKDSIRCENSIVVDSTGNVIATLGETRIQKYVSLKKIPDDLVHAYVSIEDKNFYKHKGISLKRTAAATVSYIFNKGDASFGGSTITQQLVKNITGENESSATRKMKEWDRAIKTELVLSKDQIMEAYLNIIYVGPNVYGVEAGSQYYFNKNVSELSLAECAFLAGINNSPYSYNPFLEKDNSEKIEIRTKTVLKAMLDQEYISQREYNDAIEKVEDGLEFDKGDLEPKGDGVYSYMVDATITEAIKDLEDKKNMSTSFATNYLYYSGLTIYCTQNSDIQEDIEEECENKKYMLKSSLNSNTTAQAAMIVLDHKTGQVKGCVGGLGEKTTQRGFNRATQGLRQTGSSIKPIAVLGPALQENIITPVSIYDDTKTIFENGYSPNDCESELGNITVRRAVESSQNIPFVKIMEQLTPNKAIKYLEKQGISTIVEGDNNLGLALGGLEKGASPLEMATAYATIANDGIYIEPIFYTKIENAKGKKVLKTKQKNRKVYSEDTAYVLKKLLEQPVIGDRGTAKTCKIDGMEVAAKTGTSDDYHDKWLCGFTKYYTAVTWYGFDTDESITEGTISNANQIWGNVMRNIHEDLIKGGFDKPDSVQEVIICKKTGKRACSSCKDTYIEYFKKNNVIKDVCNGHT